MSDGSLWIVIPAGQQDSGAWIDDTLKQRAAEQGMSAKVPLAADFPRQRIEVIRGPGAEDRLQELFLRRGWSDGLPVVPPTAARVKEALSFTPLAPFEVLGEVEPLMGLATVEKVAANAVMAGCRPEYLPVVLAAVACVLDPDFNMRGVQTTDENVHSAAGRQRAGGTRACHQRELRRAWPGLAGQCRDRPGDTAAYEQHRRRLAGRCCLCRSRPAGTLYALPGGERGAESLGAVVCRGGDGGRGKRGDGDACGVGDQHHGRPGRDRERDGLGGLRLRHPLERTADGADRARGRGRCARHGMGKDDVRRYLWQHGRWRRQDWEKSWLNERIVANRRWPAWVEEAAKTGDIPATRTPDDIVLVVAGGDIPIPQNAYCPSWGFPPARITREVRLPADWAALLADATATSAALVER